MNRIFISYSGNRIERALLFDALRDHGLNPWRDVESQELGDATTEVIETELVTCSAAILWLNRDVLASDYVTTVELPAIARNWREGLRIVPVFDGMRAEEASTEVSKRTGIEIGDINGYQIDADLSAEENAARIGRRLVRAHVQDARKRGQVPIVRLVSYDDTASLREDAVLNLDWGHCIRDGRLEPSDEDRLRAALFAATGALKDVYGACEVTLAVKAHLPLAVALGHALSAPTGCTLKLHRLDKDWTTTSAPAAVTQLLAEDGLKGPVNARLASLEVSISRDVRAGVTTYVQQGNRYRHRLALKPEHGPGRATVDGDQTANAWAHQIGASLVALADRSDIDRVDLFMASPVELAVLVGWWANAVGKVDLMNWRDKTGPYQRMWSIP